MRGGRFVLLVGVAVATASCGGDDDGGTPSLPASAQPYVDAVVESGIATGFTDEQARCIAPRWVSTIRVERIEGAGITPEQLSAPDSDLTSIGLSEEDAVAMYDAIEDCDADLKSIFVRQLAGTEATDEERACLADELDDDIVRDALVAGIVGAEAESETADAVIAAFFSAAQQCGVETS